MTSWRKCPNSSACLTLCQKWRKGLRMSLCVSRFLIPNCIDNWPSNLIVIGVWKDELLDIWDEEVIERVGSGIEGWIDNHIWYGRSLKLPVFWPGTCSFQQFSLNINDGLFCLFKVPPSWTKRAYASLNGLSAWYADLLLRIKELESWTSDFNLPSSVWLPGFFNPQSFLTAIMQSTARKNELPLDKMCLVCEVTKKNKEEIGAAPREGAYTHGLYMEVGWT